MGPFRVVSHLLDIGDIRVVFGRHEQQVQPLVELDPVQGGDSHVQENAEEHSQGYLPEQISDNNGEAWGAGGEAVVSRAARPDAQPARVSWGGGEVNIPTSKATSSPVTRCSLTS